MKTKNLALMIVLLLALLGLARWMQQKPAGTAAPQKAQKLVTFDVNAADRIEVRAAGATSILARAAGAWVIDSLWGHPAKFDTIADNIRRLAEAEGLPVRGGERNLAEFGLDPAATNATDLTTIVFLGGGKPLGEVALGAPRLAQSAQGGYPDGHYVRGADQPVLLTKEYLAGFPRRGQDWADKELLSLSRSDIDYIMVQPADGGQYGLVSGTNGTLEILGLATGETAKAEGVEAVAGALQSLSWANLVDPKASDEQTGLAKPATYVAHLKSGLSYTVRIGGVSTQESGRIVRLSASFEKPEPPAANVTTNADGKVVDALKDFEAAAAETAKKAAAEQARLAPWTYVLSDYVAGNLIKPRAELVQAPTNTTPPAAEAPAAAAPAAP